MYWLMFQAPLHRLGWHVHLLQICSQSSWLHDKACKIHCQAAAIHGAAAATIGSLVSDTRRTVVVAGDTVHAAPCVAESRRGAACQRPELPGVVFEVVGASGDHASRAGNSGSAILAAWSWHPARHLLRAKDLVDARYREPLDVKALARGEALPAHFSREFRREFGEPPHRYLLNRRLERAAALLRMTDRSVADICFTVGLGASARSRRASAGCSG